MGFANMRIMQELLKQIILANVNAYINYTADIFRLASKYVWYSVLLYDKEYRDMQADEKFEWGTYRQDLRDFQLVSKRDNPTARAINEASGATKACGKLSVNNDRRRGPFLPDGREICRSFNNNLCYRQDCKMMHHYMQFVCLAPILLFPVMDTTLLPKLLQNPQKTCMRLRTRIKSCSKKLQLFTF
jgi:hypothetical protein